LATKKLKKFKVKNPTSEAKHGTGFQADLPDKRDLKFSRIKNRMLKTRGVGELPKSIDLRRIMSPIRNQGSLGSCTGFSVGTGLVESLMIEHLRDPLVQVSPLFLYYCTRSASRSTNKDTGATLRDTIKAVAKFGICPEASWPYDISVFQKKPNRDAYKEAQEFKIKRYYRVKDLKDLKVSIACQNPVVLGMHLFESFESKETVKTGLAPFPDFDNEEYLGGHAMMACGWDDKKGCVLLRNSWGRGYGEGGYVWVPYECFDSKLGLVVDMWTATA
jgi:C1A family cysteine protease